LSERNNDRSGSLTGHELSKSEIRSLKTESDAQHERWTGLTELAHALDCTSNAP
jgi:hypothetical protein